MTPNTNQIGQCSLKVLSFLRLSSGDEIKVRAYQNSNPNQSRELSGDEKFTNIEFNFIHI